MESSTVIADGITEDSVDFISGLSSHLETLYNIQVLRIAPLDTDVFRIDQAVGSSWVARIFLSRPSSVTTEATATAKVLFFLRRSGFAAEKCAHEDPVSAFRGREVLVTEFLPGGTPQINAETFRRLGDFLGRLHALPFDREEISWKGGAWHHLCAQGGPHEEIAAALALLSHAKLNALTEEHASYEELRKGLAAADNFKDLPESLVHPDLVPINVIESPDGTFAPIDWIGSGWGPRIFSLGWLVFAAGYENHQMIEAVIAGYRPHIAMESAELSHLPNSIFTRQLTIACWELRNGRRKVLEVVQKLPMMRSFAEAMARCATAAFANPDLQIQAEKRQDTVVTLATGLQEVGATSIFTAAVRAEESKRSNRLFNDPLAQTFVSYWKYALPSDSKNQRAEALRKFIVARTVFFDELILSSCQDRCRQIVLLGAGMDTRAFRLPLPTDTCLYELDTADVLDSKSQVLKEQQVSPGCKRIPVPCDLRSDWSAALSAAGFDREKPTTWIVEGVVVYLEESTVNKLIGDITTMSARSSRLGLDMASNDQRGNMPWQLRRSTAPFDPMTWLAEHNWAAEVSSTRDVLNRHGRVSRDSGSRATTKQMSKPRALLIAAISAQESRRVGVTQTIHEQHVSIACDPQLRSKTP